LRLDCSVSCDLGGEELGGLTEPVVDPEVWDEVPHEQVCPAKVLADGEENGSNNRQTEIAEQDQMRIFGIVERTSRVEVVDTASEAILVALATTVALSAVLVVASDVGQQIRGPATELLIEQMESSGQRSLLSQLVQLVGESANSRRELLASLGHEDHISLHVASGFVMLAVRDLPGEVGNEQERVADPANGVVQNLAGRERLMAALVSHDPQTSAEAALDEGVGCPQSSAERCRRDILSCEEAVGEVEGGSQREHVSSNIVQSRSSRPLEAVLGNSLVNVADGVVGYFKLVAVRVDQLGHFS
jgi:signal transduction histidine kinase